MLKELTYKRTSLTDLFEVGVGSILIALCAQLSIPLPFTSVPLSLAPHVCIGLGCVLGSRKGLYAVLLYLLQGLLGLPVFALGASGVMHVLGPHGGYLLGYALATYYAGCLLERQQRPQYWALLAPMLGNGVIYLLGVAQLSIFVGFKAAMLLGVLPFLPGDALKLLLLYRLVRCRH